MHIPRKRYIPEKGDMTHLQFDPASGSKMQGDHFALVVSCQEFNIAVKMAFICPI